MVASGRSSPSRTPSISAPMVAASGVASKARHDKRCQSLALRGQVTERARSRTRTRRASPASPRAGRRDRASRSVASSWVPSCRAGAGGHSGGCTRRRQGATEGHLDVDAARDGRDRTVARDEARRDPLTVGLVAEGVAENAERPHVLELPRRDEALRHGTGAVELDQPAP